MNVQGLDPQTVQSKVTLISDSIMRDKQLFIGLSETWLNKHAMWGISIEGISKL